MITSQDIERVTKACKPLPSVAITYLKNRGLKHKSEWKFIFDYRINDLQHIQLSIALPISNITGKILGYEFRPLSKLASDRYSKTFNDNLIPIYNVRNKRFNSKVVATEGVFDCESIYQNSELNVIGLLKATPATYVLHTLAFLYSEIHLVLDSDEVGLKGATKIQQFFRKNYPDIKVVKHNIKDYTKNPKLKDPNALLEEPKAFRKLIKNLERA